MVVSGGSDGVEIHELPECGHPHRDNKRPALLKL